MWCSTSGKPRSCSRHRRAVHTQFVYRGIYGEYGISITDAADIVRRKKALRLDELKMLYKVNPESDAYWSSET